MLSLENAGIRIDGRRLVRDISLAIEPGSVTAIVGPNGSGKSTVLRLLAGLWKCTEGGVTLDSRPLNALARRDIARRVAFVPQDTQVGFGFTAHDIVAMGRHAHLGRFESPRAQDQAAIDSALERADVAHLSDRPVDELSGGERQRVLIARSLATEADVILLDEPTSNLDVDHSLEVLELLRELAGEGKSVAVALHDLNAVFRWADRAALLHQGRLNGAGPVGEVLADQRVSQVFGVKVERLRAADGKTAMRFHRQVRR